MASTRTWIDIAGETEAKVVSMRETPAEFGVSLPIKAGRQTVPEDYGTLGGFVKDMALIEPDFNVQLLAAIEKLATYHPDLSQAVENVVTLGNTNYTIYFEDGISETMQSEMVSRIKKKSKSWYAYSGGLNSLINDLLAQLAVTGAISAESVPDSRLDGIDSVVVVNPKNIKFIYDKDLDEYCPRQQVPNALMYAVSDDMTIPLNTATYSYISMRRFAEKPYGVPPFLSALDNISIGNYMNENLKHIVKKLGVLGFLEVLVNGPKPRPGESDASYYERSKGYLDQIIPEVEKGMRKGYVAGYKDMHEFNMHSITSNVQGAKDLLELNDTKTMSGLKQDPLMFGRNFNTTETLARVILAKMTTQVANYQKVVASFLERLFLLDLQLAGYPVNFLDVEFDPPMTGDKQREEEAYSKKLENLRTLLNLGVIDIDQFAVAAGYEEPADPDKHLTAFGPFPDGGVSDGDNGTDPNDEQDATDPATTESNKKLVIDGVYLNSHLPLYPYDYDATDPSFELMSLSNSADDNMSEFIRQYYKKTKDNYTKAIAKVTAKIGRALGSLGNGATEKEVEDLLIYTLFVEWGASFNNPQKKIISRFVKRVYSFFRKDKSMFRSSTDSNLPNGVFDSIDYRALEYYRKIDELYLGKFITDPDVRKEITKYIKDAYLSRELPIGDNVGALSQFKSKFPGVLQGKDWKILQIVSTTVSKMRNTAAVAYFAQAEVEWAEIRGVNDRLQCQWCARLQGRRVQISKALEAVTNTYNSEPEFVSVDTPFITSVFPDPLELDNVDDGRLQDLNIHHPPYHPHCRDVLVPIL